MNEVNTLQTPQKKSNTGKWVMIGCLGTVGGLGALLVALIVISVVFAALSQSKDKVVLDTFIESIQQGDGAKAYAMLDPAYRESYSQEDFQSFVESVRLAEATGYEKKYLNDTDGESLYEIEVTAPGAPPVPFYAYVKKGDDGPAVTRLTLEKPADAGISVSSTTTVTKQFVKSPLQKIYISDTEESLMGDIAVEEADPKAGSEELFCRIEYERAHVGSQLRISWHRIRC